jgi:hypothetical protein
MFHEVQFELVKLILLNVFLSSIIVFLIADFVALIFSMPIWYVVVLSIVYFLITFVMEVRKISVHYVEEKNPELREILRTAKDNISDDTIMAHALFYEVLEKMKRVSSGTFLDFKKLVLKIGAIFVLAIILVSLAFFNVNISKFEDPLSRPLKAIGGFFGKLAGQDVPAGDLANDDVFGDPSMAKLGGDQLVATVNPSLSTPDFNNIDPSAPSNDPLADLGADGQAGFNTPTGGASSTLSEKELQRVDNYWTNTQK